MLPREQRLHRRAEFSDVLRRGRRASGSLLTVHMLSAGSADDPARAGLVVSKAVGGSVTRSRVARRLRHQLREVLPTVPGGSRIVVRAARAASDADSAALGAELRRAFAKLGYSV